MKVALLAAGSSIHTIRWANSLAKAGTTVVLITQHKLLEPISPDIKVHKLRYSGGLGYFLNVRSVRHILDREMPDVVNAHYASGYGTTARFVNFKPMIISVWGSDVYSFPAKSAFHRMLVSGNLMAADKVASTSLAMAEQTRQIAPSLDNIAITPFGVDLNLFMVPDKSSTAEAPLVIGTVKSLASHYGIDLLIDSFALLMRRMKSVAPSVADRLRLRIIGDGPDNEVLKEKARKHELSDCVEFMGRVSHGQVPGELAKLDIYVALSRQESFGVAVIEASACGLPVVVSDVGGLPEVVQDGKTGTVVPREDANAAAVALERLVLDPLLRQAMGAAGRKLVEERYEWGRNVDQMIALYEDVVARRMEN